MKIDVDDSNWIRPMPNALYHVEVKMDMIMHWQ